MSDEQRNREFIVATGLVLQEVFDRTVALAEASIKTGSPLTGAPGQPVDTQQLLLGWITERDGPDRAVIGNNELYTEAVEDGVGPHGTVVYGAKNGIGGSHSLKLTEANFDRIIAEARRSVTSGA